MHRFLRIFKSVVEYHRPFHRAMTLLFTLLIIGQIIFLVRPYLQGRLIDDLQNGTGVNELVGLTLLIFASYTLVNILGYLREAYEWKFYFKMHGHISIQTLQKLFRYSIGQHTNEHSGLKLSVIERGEQSIKQLLDSTIYDIIPLFFQIILSSAAIMFVSPMLGAIIFFSSLLYMYLMLRYNINIFPKFRENEDKWKKVHKEKAEILRYLSLVKAESQEEETVEMYRKIYNNITGFSEKLWIDSTAGIHKSQVLVDVAQSGTVLIAAILVINGIETSGAVVAIIGWIAGIFGNISNIGWMQRRTLEHMGHIETYLDLLSIPPAIIEDANAMPLQNMTGEIHFENVTFAYPRVKSIEEDEGDEEEKNPEEEVSRETLNDMTFEMNAGETVALVGHSGAGKTTIVQLILRGYDPDKGVVKIDGHDLKSINVKDYRKNIGYVEQNVRLFDGTLRHNILFGVKDKASITEEMLEEVSKKARIDQFYERLGNKKFGALIGENGIWLSGGERQRVGIARALIKDPKILIFDEATSSLDSENEKLIHEAMREALKGRTGIIIAHRLSTIKDADKIIVLEKGSVVGIGKHAELLETCEQYKKLVENQVVV